MQTLTSLTPIEIFLFGKSAGGQEWRGKNREELSSSVLKESHMQTHSVNLVRIFYRITDSHNYIFRNKFTWYTFKIQNTFRPLTRIQCVLRVTGTALFPPNSFSFPGAHIPGGRNWRRARRGPPLDALGCDSEKPLPSSQSSWESMCLVLTPSCTCLSQLFRNTYLLMSSCSCESSD